VKSIEIKLTIIVAFNFKCRKFHILFFAKERKKFCKFKIRFVLAIKKTKMSKSNKNIFATVNFTPRLLFGRNVTIDLAFMKICCLRDVIYFTC